MTERSLILYYDEYHTPIADLKRALSDWALDVLCVDLEGAAVPPRGEVHVIDARDRFCDNFVARAVKANACYQDGYYLSAALSRPLLAEVVVEHLARLHASTLIHGFAGNDALRFTTGVLTLSPSTRIVSVAEVCGSRTTALNDEYTVSGNIWGWSVEAGELADPSTIASPAALDRLPARDASPATASERHTIAFECGKPVALDGCSQSLRTIVERLTAIGQQCGAGRTDLVEDGFVGLKTRAVYDAPAAMALVAAHRDLEKYVSTRRQNRFKPLVDSAWAELVYEGGWFDPARDALEAYIDATNAWVTGEVDLLFAPGGIRVVARRSSFAVYDRNFAVYRVGQDFGAQLIQQLAEAGAMGAGIARARAHSMVAP